MSMLTLTGQLINVFESPKGEKDGKEFGGQSKVQILGQIALQNGETKNELVTLTTHNPSYFNDMEGKTINVPVSCFANSKTITYFIPKGSQPHIV